MEATYMGFAISDLILLGIVGLIIMFARGYDGGYDPKINKKTNKSLNSDIKNLNKDFNAERFKLSKDLRNAKLNLEELYIKKEENENDIEKYEQEGIMDFKKEKENKTKIKRLKLNIEHLDDKIAEMINKINDLNVKIEEYDG